MRDMNDPMVQDEYDRNIFDGARDLALRYKEDPSGMREALKSMGVPAELYDPVINAMAAPDYLETLYRGAMVDDLVIETLKDCLRPLHGF